MDADARAVEARTRGHTVGRSVGHTVGRTSDTRTPTYAYVLYHEIVPCVRCVTYTCGSTARRFAALALALAGFATRASVSRARTVGFRFHRERETTTRELFFSFFFVFILCID